MKARPWIQGWNMRIEETIEEKRNEIIRIAARHGVKQVRVFGSAARSQSRPDSDVDFLVEVEGPTPPWFPGGLVAELEALLGRRVDVVEPEALSGPLRESILKDAVPMIPDHEAGSPALALLIGPCFSAGTAMSSSCMTPFQRGSRNSGFIHAPAAG
jgi:predicted nucleotidyltransferase